jgi:hypothetical protein
MDERTHPIAVTRREKSLCRRQAASAHVCDEDNLSRAP